MDAADAQQVEVWLSEVGEASALLIEEAHRILARPLASRASVGGLRVLVERVEPGADAHASLSEVEADALL